MENNFLDNYKKKSNQDLQEISEKIGESEEVAQTEPESTDEAKNDNTSEMNFTQKSTFKPPSNQVSRPQNQKKFPLIAVIVGAVAIIIVLILVLTLNKGVILPDMSGWAESDAKLWATENGALVRVETAFDENVESGKIISQDPASGEELASGSFVEIIVSQGPDLSVMVKVPDIENMTMQEVEAWADENLMTKVRVTTEESQTIAIGKVISITVNDDTVIGEEIRRDTPLYVVFSKGVGEGKPIELPDFTLITLQEAQEFAEENGIILEIIEEFDEVDPKGTIMKQSVDAEEIVKTGDTITLTVSKGKEILIPNFGQYSKDTVELKASQLGITVNVTERYSSSNANVFLSQSKAIGSLYEEDDIVELVYSLGNKVEFASYVEQSIDGLKAWVNPLNEQGANIRLNITYTVSDKPAGTILSHDKANTTISVYDTINLVVSEGAILYVPDLVTDPGLTYADAMTREKVIEICSALQLVPVFIEEEKAGRLQGEVHSQSLQPGVQVKAGATIELRYVPVKDTYAIPDFSGLTKAEISAKGYDKLFTITYIDGYEDGMENKAIAQSEKAGTVVAAGTNVSVTIGGAKTILDPEPQG